MSTIAKPNKNTKIKLMKTDYAFLAFDLLVMSIVFIVILYPLLYVISCSFSGGKMVGGGLSLIPLQTTLEGYTAVIEDASVWRGYGNSLIYTVCGTALALLVTTLCAYPLSRPKFKNGKYMMLLCVFTMYFSGGLIPFYLVVKNLNLVNSRFLMIITGCASVYNMIIIRSFFTTSMPVELYEAASIDGCTNQRYFFAIVLPLSKAIIAVIALYNIVAQWNSYFNAMIFLSDRSKYPLQLFLREILLSAQTYSDPSVSGGDAVAAAQMEIMGEVIKYGVIVVSTLPVIVIYPFLQKYFVQGVMIGSIKG